MKKNLIALTVAFSSLSAPAQNCPASIQVHAPDQVTEGDTLLFFAQMKSATSISVTYNWSISNGMIISGQGTESIWVITDSLGGMSITATVELGGLPRECISNSSSTAQVMDAAEKIISANYTTPQALTAAIKKFITQTDLKNITISQTAFIYVYRETTTTAAQLKAINSAIIKELEKNGIFSFQYQVADGGKKKSASFEMYRLMPGSNEPKPSK